VRPSEARWIADALAAFPQAQISPFINIGSSTAEFRTSRQPHIDALIFAPMRKAGVDVIHTDLKAQPGVDVAGDLADPAVRDQVKARAPRAALSSNLLEHVPDPAAFARMIESLVEPGGLLVVTVPRSYPYHADPIDNGFRPTPEELARLFPGCTLVRGDVVADTSYGQEILGQGRAGLKKGLRNLVGALRPRGEVARAQRDRLRWLFRPFTTTCVVLRRNPTA
jgi:hypothetical protein